MKPQIVFKGKSYDFDKFEYEVDEYELSTEEVNEFWNLVPKYSLDYSKRKDTWTGDETIIGYERYLDDKRYM